MSNQQKEAYKMYLNSKCAKCFFCADQGLKLEDIQPYPGGRTKIFCLGENDVMELVSKEDNCIVIERIDKEGN